MNLYVEAKLGFGETRRRWLGHGQRVSVGSSEWADLTIDEDFAMADVHFELAADDGDFLVRDLTGTSSVSVNGDLVSVSRVRNKDVICAGATRFCLNVDSTTNNDAAVSIVHEEICPSGIVLTYSPGTQPLDAVSRMLDDGFHFVIDSSLSRRVTNFGEQQQILNTNENVGPILVSPANGAMAQQLTTELIGHNYTVVISRRSPVETLTEIRRKVGSFIASSTLRNQLTNSPTEYAKLLTEGFDAILIADEASECQIFANEGYRERLDSRTSGL